MDSKSKSTNEFLIKSEKADYISFFFNKHEFKLIKVNNDCGLNNTDYIEFTDKEVLEQGFLEALEKNCNLSNVSNIHFRLIPLIKDYEIRIKSINFLTQNNFKNKKNYSLFINLDKSKEILKKNIRKSYKSLINKEKKKNKILFLTQNNFNKKNYEEWINLYNSALSRGGKELDDEAIKIKENAIKNRELFLSLAYQNQKLLGGMAFNLNKYYCSYSAAANNTEIEKDKSRSVGHFLLWESIINLKEIGVKFLDLGSYDENNLNDEKFNNKIKFKKGFGPKELLTNYFSKIL